jgi:hypothetical protein
MPFVRGVSKGVRLGAAALCLASLAACAGGGGTKTFQTQEEGGGWNPFGGRGKSTSGSQTPAIAVNGYLWRATLDTLAFMPLASADPYGGVIITDWYTNPEKPDERFKCTVYILDARLRADGLNVSVFKQQRDATGTWVDVASSPQTETDMENAILTRARQLRLSNING